MAAIWYHERQALYEMLAMWQKEIVMFDAIGSERERQHDIVERLAHARKPHVPQCLCIRDQLQIKCAEWGTPCLLYQAPEPPTRRRQYTYYKDSDDDYDE